MSKIKATFGSKVILCLKLHLSNNLKTTKANLMKHHRKIKSNEKICHVTSLVPTFEVKATIRGQRLSRLCNNF